MDELRLCRCDLSVCEAMCCYAGVHLLSTEAVMVQSLMEKHKAFFSFLPEAPLERTRDSWKTATKPHEYKNPNFPVEFTRTRCVFCMEDAKCSLQVISELEGYDSWYFKFMACWLHPLYLW